MQVNLDGDEVVDLTSGEETCKNEKTKNVHDEKEEENR